MIFGVNSLVNSSVGREDLMNWAILDLHGRRWSHVGLTSIEFDGELRETGLERREATLFVALSNRSHIQMGRVHY